MREFLPSDFLSESVSTLESGLGEIVSTLESEIPKRKSFDFGIRFSCETASTLESEILKRKRFDFGFRFLAKQFRLWGLVWGFEQKQNALMHLHKCILVAVPQPGSA